VSPYGRALRPSVRRTKRIVILIRAARPPEGPRKPVARRQTTGRGLIYWCQIFYSLAAAKLLARRLPGIGNTGSGPLLQRAGTAARCAADHVITSRRFLAADERLGHGPVNPCLGDRELGQRWDAKFLIGAAIRGGTKSTGWGRGRGSLFRHASRMKHNPRLLIGFS